MKNILKLLVAIIMLIVTPMVYGDEEGLMLTLTLHNHSNKTLIYKGVIGKNLGNSYSVTPNKLLPGNTATVIGKTTNAADLSGQLQFVDKKGNMHLFTILDQLQFHIGEPIFSMSDDEFNSIVESKTFNRIKVHAL